MNVSYIVTPFEDVDSAKRFQYEILRLKNADKNKDIQIITNPLIPYFGTKIRKKYYDLLMDPDNPFLINDDTINWDPDSNPFAFNFMYGILLSRTSDDWEFDIENAILDASQHEKPYMDQPAQFLIIK